MGLKINKKGARGIVEHKYGVCLWEMPDGKILASGPTVFLSMEGRIRDPAVENKMKAAARYWLGSDFEGHPVWVPGARKITDDEYDDQMDRLLDGKIPDPVEEVRLKKRGEI